MRASSTGREDALFRTLIKGQPVTGIDRWRIGETTTAMRQGWWSWFGVIIVNIIVVRVCSPIISIVVNVSCLSPFSGDISIHLRSVRVRLRHDER